MADIPLADLLLGVEAIDTDHAEAVALWKELKGAQGPAFVAALEKWVAHLEAHFAREEDLMKAAGYRDLPHHASEHARVVAEGKRFLDQARSGRTMMARAYATDMIPDWFERHVRMFDSEVARVVKLAGVG